MKSQVIGRQLASPPALFLPVMLLLLDEVLDALLLVVDEVLLELGRILVEHLLEHKDFVR